MGTQTHILSHEQYIFPPPVPPAGATLFVLYEPDTQLQVQIAPEGIGVPQGRVYVMV